MNTIVTIGRQFGSGGHEIGSKLADKLGIKCYDKELIKIAAKATFIKSYLKKAWRDIIHYLLF